LIRAVAINQGILRTSISLDLQVGRNWFELQGGYSGEQNYLDELLASEGHTFQCLRTDAFRFRRESFETIDRLIERQLKNIRLLMQAYDSVRFALQVHKKMALEIEQLELQVKQSREDQRLEVDRQ
jgi:hypothetical protein